MLGVAIGLVGRLKNSVSPYAVLGYSPGLVLDFVEEHYRTNSLLTTFDSALTATRAGNATMVDSDGKIKWAPHNLLTYSEQFDNAAWSREDVTVVSNATVAPDGASTAEKIVENTATTIHRIRQTYTPPSEAVYSFSFYAKAAERTMIRCQIYSSSPLAGADVNLSDGTLSGIIGSAYISNVGNGWYRVTISATVPAAATIFRIYPIVGGSVSYTGDGTSGIYLWGAHLYRSDLGGMADVPSDARAIPSATKYVPTTSAARYLPRRGHHVYNGSEWVNEGLLVESEARTNLVTYSETSVANWTASGATRTQLSGSYLGAFAGVRVTSTGASWNRLETTDLSWTSGQTYNLTFFYVAGTSGRVLLNLRDNTAGTESRANGPIGSVVAGAVYAGTVTNVATETLPGGVYKTTYTFVPNNTTNLGRVGIGPDSTTAGQDIIALGAQLEAGSTPSSYIPTAGATVTRAAETLVIPSANLPWPSPQYVTGTELVTNGTFDTDTNWTKPTGWSIGSGMASYDGTGARYSKLFQVLPLPLGKVYAVTFTLSGLSDSSVTFGLGDTPGTFFGIGSNKAVYQNGTHSEVFVSPSANASLIVQNNSATQMFTVDNISVKEINPLSVSIAMDGRATGNTLTTARWYNSSTAYITQSIGTTNFSFDQYGAAAPVTGGTFTSGINVPFNIASRHGSTFINGAVDGVALTADLTPVALPNLSATDLQLGSTFMGVISKFRVWSDDLGDAGIAEASA